ncbi:hypothetical protein MS3_00000644 [Schistosoma haematobium]|uniref:Uncharacterized protein n=1 Tax=Schistosoma haematobium TaxID=6185 RepID=A0A922IL44_SCHHA|nr:hypothetical protein MS3_00000644 [Schistosoma haematobium]KAH9581865.1 hypothetical protein MS3_00000644 [Schistosoma haematobium]
MFYERKQGARTFNDIIETIHVNKFKSPLVTSYNFTELIDCFEKQKKHHQIEADSRNGSVCYINLSPQYIEVIQKIDETFENLYRMYYEFGKYLFLFRFGWANIFE